LEYRTPEGSQTALAKSDNILQAHLTVDYTQKTGVLRDARIDVSRGEIVGLVGQSGSGKSTLALSILRLLDPANARIQGRVLLEGSDLLHLPEREMRSVRGKQIALIPQSASSTLNRALRIGTQLRESWNAHANSPWADELARIRSLLKSCGLPDDDAFLRRYPDQISLGQAQRVLIVMAVLHRPSLLIADEPTSALDVVTQEEVLELIRRINIEQQMSVLFISHDLPVVAALCHRIAILHEGLIVESGPVCLVLNSPAHDYTKKLVEAVKHLQLEELGGLPDRVGD
jgi:ABC-type glutathione transport system ATPase component